MWRRMGRWGIFLGLAALAGAVVILFATQEPAQGFKKKEFPPQPTPGPGSGTASGLSSVRIIEDSQWRRVVQAGSDAVKQQDWKVAIEGLQPVLNLKKDLYVQVT